MQKIRKIRITESELKGIISEAVKKVIKESYRGRSTSSVCYLKVNGNDFVKKTIQKFGNGINPSVVLNNEQIAEIMNDNFLIEAEESYSPQTYWEPGGGEFEIIDDEGLYDIIDSIQDKNIKKLFEKGYDEFVYSNSDYDYGPDKDDFADELRDRIRDDKATGDY